MSVQLPTPATDCKHAPLDKISDVDCLQLLQSRKVECYLEVTKNKKMEEVISQTLRWVDTKEPLLTKRGSIECRGTILFGVHTKDKRNTGKFSKADSNFDECDFTCGAKYSGTHGALMCYLSDTFPANVKAMCAREEYKAMFAGHELDPHELCKKRAGSLIKPAAPDIQAAYTKAADWHFPVKLKIRRRTETGAIDGTLFMCNVQEYKKNKKGQLELVDVHIDSDTINNELTRDTQYLLQMRPGNCTRKMGDFKGQPVSSFTASYNVGHIIRLKKGERGGVMTPGHRSDADARALLASVGAAIDDDDEYEDGDDGSNQQQGQPSFKPGTGPATVEDITKQLAGLGIGTTPALTSAPTPASAAKQ